MTPATTMRRAAMASSAVLLMSTAGGHAQSPNYIFIVKSSSKAPDAVVAAIKSYAELKKWPHLGDNKVKQGELTLVNVSIPDVVGALWPVGLQVSALLPCGNLGVYSKGGITEVSSCTRATCTSSIPMLRRSVPGRSPCRCSAKCSTT